MLRRLEQPVDESGGGLADRLGASPDVGQSPRRSGPIGHRLEHAQLAVDGAGRELETRAQRGDIAHRRPDVAGRGERPVQAGRAVLHLAAQPRQLGGPADSVAAGRQLGSVDQDDDATSDPTHGRANDEEERQSAHQEKAQHHEERVHPARLPGAGRASADRLVARHGILVRGDALGEVHTDRASAVAERVGLLDTE